MERLEELVHRVESLADAEAREAALELLQAVMELHGNGFARLLEAVKESEDSGALMERFARDPLISGVLLLHDLHPEPLETRVRHALENPALKERGAAARVVSVENGVVRVRAEGSEGFVGQVRAALVEAAPDAADLVVDAAVTGGQGFVPLAQLLTAQQPQESAAVFAGEKEH